MSTQPPDDTVYVPARNGGGSATIHTDRDCRCLANVKKIHARPRDVYPEHTHVCKYCSGEWEHGTGTPDHSTRQLLDSMDPDEL